MKLLIGLFIIAVVVGAGYAVGRIRKPKGIDPNRIVIATPEQDPPDMPATVNAWFACSDINEDSKTGGREPWDGYVVLRGQTYSCREFWDRSSHQSLGTIQPGETKTITVPIRPN